MSQVIVDSQLHLTPAMTEERIISLQSWMRVLASSPVIGEPVMVSHREPRDGVYPPEFGPLEL